MKKTTMTITTTHKTGTKSLVARRRNEFCVLRAELRLDTKYILSITGEYGDIWPFEDAKAESRLCIVSYFEDVGEAEAVNVIRKHGDPSVLADRDADVVELAADVVQEIDGPLHTLDIYRNVDEVWIIRSCGQIRDELERFFPEHSWVYKYHLNDMRAGCEHQRELGWGRSFDVAITRQSITPAQRTALWKVYRGEIERKAHEKDSDFCDWVSTLKNPDSAKTFLAHSLGRVPRNSESAILESVAYGIWKSGLSDFLDPAHQYLRSTFSTFVSRKHFEDMAEMLLEDWVSRKHEVWEPHSQIFTDSIGAPCPECGYRFGTEWKYEQLPDSVLKWFESLEDGAEKVIASD